MTHLLSLPWKAQPWLHRDADYKALKLHIQRAILDRVEKHYPGFSE